LTTARCIGVVGVRRRAACGVTVAVVLSDQLV
jgi:hypothetical protein